MTKKINAFDALTEIARDQYDKQELDNKWINTDMHKMSLLKNDHSGKVGERWLERICKDYNIPHEYHEDIIDSEATYDIKIRGKRVEVKTARQGRGLLNKKTNVRSPGNWQHEQLRKTGCDKYVFIDAFESGFYVTVLDANFDYSNKHPIMQITPHRRKGTDDVYKFDFGLPSIARGIRKGVTIKISKNTDPKVIEEFVKKHL